MADNIPFQQDGTKFIATDDAGANGHVQILKLAISADGVATVIPADASNGLDVDVTRVQGDVGVEDHTPPVDPLVKSGTDVTDTSTLVVAANLGRIKVEIMNASSARIWLGVGEAAVAGQGNFLEPGVQWYEYTTQSVQAIHELPGELHHVSVQEWAA